MQIQPLASSAHAYRRPYLPFANACSAFRALLQSFDFKEGEKILLPAYEQAVALVRRYGALVQEDKAHALYHEMRKNGFGLVSLYYRLIEEIVPEEFPEAQCIAATITNLPVHQDIGIEALDKLLFQLRKSIEQLS